MTNTIVLLFGGTSSERRVSVASAQNLSGAVPDLEPWFIAPGGAVHSVSPTELTVHQHPFEGDFLPSLPARWPHIRAALDATQPETVFFLALHGGEGENGTLQCEFEKRFLAFTGSDSAASELAFDKARAKTVVAGKGVQVAAASVLDGREDKVLSQLTELWRARARCQTCSGLIQQHCHHHPPGWPKSSASTRRKDSNTIRATN